MTQDKSASQAGTYLPWLLGLLLLAIYLFVYRGGFHSVDELSMFAVTESLVKEARPTTDQIAWTQWVTTQREAQGFIGQDGHVYSKKGLGLSLFQYPFYWLGLLLPGIGMLQTVSLLNALVTAAAGVLLFKIMRMLQLSRGAAVFGVLVYGLGTIAFVYAKYLFSEPLSGLLLLASTYYLLKFRQVQRLGYIALSGLAGGLALLTRANNAVILPILSLFALLACLSRRSWKKSLLSLGIFALTATLGLALFGWYNAVRAGNPFSTGYDLSIFSPSVGEGLYKLLFSPLRGLFIYSPVLLLMFPGLVMLWRRDRFATGLFLLPIAATAGLFSVWSSGEGLSWGSRFLVPVIPQAVLLSAPCLEWSLAKSRRPGLVGVSALALVSAAIQVSGVVINPWVYLGELQNRMGGEFFLEKTRALTDFGYVQFAGQIKHWSVENSDILWWQVGRINLPLMLAGILLILICAWGVRRAAAKKVILPRLSPAFWAGGEALLASGLALFMLNGAYAGDPQFGGPQSGAWQAFSAVESRAGKDDALVSVAPYHYHVAMNIFKAPISHLGLAAMEEPLQPQAENLLKLTAAGRRTIWLVTVGLPPASPHNGAEKWLAEHAYPAEQEWFGDARLVRFGLADPGAWKAVNNRCGEDISLTAAAFPDRLAAGGILPVALRWRAERSVGHNYRVYLQLLDGSGQAAVQRDDAPLAGFAPTETWTAGMEIDDHHGLAAPAQMTPGRYQLIAGLYDPAGGERLHCSGSEYIVLGSVDVEAAK